MASLLALALTGERDMIYGDSLHIDAQVQQSNSTYPCVVETISDTIIKIECAAQLDPETTLSLMIPGMNTMTANLLWKKKDEYGCQIDYIFHPAVIKSVMDRLDRKRVLAMA